MYIYNYVKRRVQSFAWLYPYGIKKAGTRMDSGLDCDAFQGICAVI